MPLRSLVNPKIDLQSLIKPNCELVKSQNKHCLRLRQHLRDSKSETARDYANLDILLITFEGVLGSFLPLAPQRQEEKTDTLVMRPGVTNALEMLIRNFKVVLITSEQSSVHIKTIVKVLNKMKVPYDALYRHV